MRAEQRALLRLGVESREQAYCRQCGERRLAALEAHHPAGRVRGEPITGDVVPLCANCHRCLSDPADQAHTNEYPDALFLEGMADIFIKRAQQLRGKGATCENASTY